MHRHVVWATPIALGLTGVTLAGAPVPVEAGQERADLLVQVRVESPCSSTLRGDVVEQRCGTGTPARARIESARPSPPAASADLPRTMLSSAGEPGPSYLTVIY